MRVALDVRPLQVGTKYRGTGTYIRELLEQYLKRRRELVLMAWPEEPISLDKGVLNSCEIVRVPRNSSLPVFKYFGYKRDGLENSAAYAEVAKKADLLHFTDPQDLRFGFPWNDIGVPRVLTVHNLMSVTHSELFFNRDFIKMNLLKFIYRDYVQKYSQCDAILTDSQFTEHTLHNVVKERLPITKTIMLGISDRYVLPFVSQVDEYRLQRKLPARFILHVGALTGNKNVEALLQSTAPVCNWPFVFAGPYSEEDKDYFTSKYPQQKIFWLGYVDREELPMLYAAASLMAFPSLIEGFGLPILEAMAVGTPVICSNTSSMVEVAGGAAIMFNPQKFEEIRNAIHMVMNDENMRMQMRTRGLERAQHLSWRRTADTTWMVYEGIVEDYQRRRKKRNMSGV
ncbi:MAG: glycosyltransferase family 4 protein [Candidatus Bruticola sp.]